MTNRMIKKIWKSFSFAAVFVFFLVGVSSAANVTIVSAMSAKGNCYIAGQDLTLTINATNPASWANLHALVIGSADTTLDYSINGASNPDDCLWGLVTGGGNTPTKPAWTSVVQLNSTAATASGSSVTNYQMVVPVPASYTTGGLGQKTFFVVIDQTTSTLAMGQYNVQGSPVWVSVTLPECSLDTATPTPTITPTLYAIFNYAWASYSNTGMAYVEIQQTTFTNTPTSTPSPTSTNTQTATPTITNSSTATSTPTSTQTLTATPTITITTLDSPTVTPTDSPTCTDTPTNTITLTATITVTETSTPTETDTMTVTYTCTETPTSTNTDTVTPTDTMTDTMTVTPIFTFTCTATSTPTDTQTVTYTDTPTVTVTNTDTPTDTQTLTITPSATPTFTMTVTETATVTLTKTPTSTVTSTPTITPTLPPYPYILTINLYNEAGELVKTIANTPSSNVMTGAKISVNGTEDGVVTSKDKMLIFIPGVDTPISFAAGAVGGATYNWNADNNSSQSVNSGLYYIKFEQKDQFGHSNVFIKQVQVVKEEEYVQLNIFNSSGEIVRTITGKTPVDLNTLNAKDLSIKVSDARTNKVSDVVAIDKNGTAINITYGPDTANDIISWNGMNNMGDAVSSGTYEMQVIVKTLSGSSVESTKTVVVLNEGKQYMSDVKILPNPYNGKVRTNMAITWKSGGAGDVDVKIFNSVGELVRTVHTKLESGGILWDMRTASGDEVAQGYYICVIQARDSNGYSDRKIEKLVIEK
jgi:hypothetical protein